MGSQSFGQTAKYWNDWACQSIKLVKEFLEKDGKTNLDEPRLRSYYILLSYAFELMIKSRLVAISGIKEYKLISSYGHDVGKILKTLNNMKELGNIGIESFTKEKIYIYNIKTTDKESFYI
jgi:hypothetical protein